MSTDSTADRMRRESAGRIAHAAICYIGAALTNINPDSGFAAAPVYDPPEGPTGWPLDKILWKPKFDDPARMLVEAAELLQLAYDLLVNETSFDDNAPSRAASQPEPLAEKQSPASPVEQSAPEQS